MNNLTHLPTLIRPIMKIILILTQPIFDMLYRREREREREIILLRSIVNMMIHVQIKITMWIDPRRPALRPWRSLTHRPP